MKVVKALLNNKLAAVIQLWLLQSTGMNTNQTGSLEIALITAAHSGQLAGGCAFACGAGGLRFKYRTSQMRQRNATVVTFL